MPRRDDNYGIDSNAVTPSKRDFDKDFRLHRVEPSTMNDVTCCEVWHHRWRHTLLPNL